ncbi:MAG TPA: DEAD/DEAH box helicase [Acidimicrobiales bacterium]|jgi:ATP-dependent RNA helicase HelY|nr:DEAD/DEAH box helicase [Acidimicrobiales bacterium]
MTEVRDSGASYHFTLDPFQRQAIEALEAGQSVLVAAPTGAGKTVVAEHAVRLALQSGGKAFYTAPIKALSNQKYGDLARRHGADRVGLLTGDNSVNSTAPVVVMTTEVLRNMIYAESSALDGLQFVVLDEVHYLQDTYRGPVWEEVILHLPAPVRLVCLSATVSNAEELADWITTVRGPTAAVIEDRRPVELVNLYCVGDRTTPDLHLLPTLVDGRPNAEAARLDAESLRAAPVRGRPRRRFFTPRRVEVVERLAADDLLPAIFFIFSRAACDDAVDACIAAGLRLSEPDERARIRAIAEHHVESLSDADLDVLGYDRWLAALEAGIAAHHAGMVPPFKEAVETCFAEGLVRVVFATETLALGINMPARTVVIEKLSKFTGERHEFLTPGEYTQLTGRAGRRGLDPVGYAVVLWSPFVPFEQVASLASSRAFRLTSAFRPTYNMAANLVQRYEPADAHHLLNLSFAQYQADRSVVRLETRLDKRRAARDAMQRDVTCDRGDVTEYRALLDQVDEARRRVVSPRGQVAEALARLRPGDVIEITSGRRGGRAAVLSFANRREESRLKVITTNRKLLTLDAADFDAPPDVVGHVELPVPYAPNNHSFQQNVARRLQQARLRGPVRSRPPRAGVAEHARAVERAEAHPVARCPDRDRHLRAIVQTRRAEAEVNDLERRVKGETGSLARHFDRVLRVLEAWGYLDGWSLTAKGRHLAHLYHESDLLICEALHTGVFDELDPAAFAGLVSVFTYEHRSANPPPAPWFPSSKVRQRYAQIVQLADELNTDEHEAALSQTRVPDPGFVALAHAWTAGGDLDSVLEDEDVSGGDFVRNLKQLIDLLRQIGDTAPLDATRRTAHEAADRCFRGVVSASSVVGTAIDDDEPIRSAELLAVTDDD